MSKPRIFSGVQPSGNLHIGNYLGAISQFVKLQETYDCVFCVVDYHAITVRQEPEKLKKNIIEIAKLFMAAGIDPKKSIIFQQSRVTAHTELSWILNCITRNSDLTKMIQFKDKAMVDFDYIDELLKDIEVKKETVKKQGIDKVVEKIKNTLRDFQEQKDRFNKVGVGLFDYPVLMAADILLYQTDAVPVGEDQSQHVELTRTLARRFNQQYGTVFKEPELILRKEGARIMGLDDATKKMSKSASSEYNYIALTDEPSAAAKKIMRAETDSGKEIKYDIKDKPGISNLLTIYSLLKEKNIKDLEKEYQGKGYGDFKKDLAEVVKDFLVKFQEKYNSISDKEVRKILDAGAKKAQPIAAETLRKVKEKIGVN